MRTCPGCNQQFPAVKEQYRRKWARPVWTCTQCYKRQRREAGLETMTHKIRIPGAIEGHGPKRASPETQARLAALFRTDPEKVIHKLCDLMEGFHAGEKLKAIARAARKGQGICPGGA